MSVRLSVRLSHVDILSKRLNISSNFFHHSDFFQYQTVWQYFDWDPHPNAGIECKGYEKNQIFGQYIAFSEIIQDRATVTTECK